MRFLLDAFTIIKLNILSHFISQLPKTILLVIACHFNSMFVRVTCRRVCIAPGMGCIVAALLMADYLKESISSCCFTFKVKMTQCGHSEYFLL